MNVQVQSKTSSGMIDLHCHLLPGIDDGARDLDVALSMAQMAIDDGITTLACTPHIYPGMYENTAPGIRQAIADLQAQLDQRDMPLQLVQGADVHLQPDLAGSIRSGRVPTLAASRYLLLEPPHHVAPPRFEESVFELQVAGYVAVITHPERLSWLADHYPMMQRLVRAGAWMQVTAGSLTGRFGRNARYWAERMLDDGLVHLLATDAHDPQRRPPLLAEGREAAAQRIGRAQAWHLVHTRPAGIVANRPVADLPALAGTANEPQHKAGFWQALLGARP